MRVFLALLLVTGTAAADGYRMAKSGGTCGVSTKRVMAPFDLVMDAADSTVVEDVSGKGDDQVSKLTTENFDWQIRVYKAEKADLDFTKAKNRVVEGAKKSKSKLTWKTSEKTPDGFRLLWMEDDSLLGKQYSVFYLRTINKKQYVCWNMSGWADSYDCIAKACESLRPK